MKTIKILLPAAMTFAMFIGMNNAHAQSAYAESTASPMTTTVLNMIPKKTVGLDYTQSLVQINNALTKGVKSDHSIDYQGKVLVDIAIDNTGHVLTISFDKELPTRLAQAIDTTLRSTSITPVRLNGIAKAQTFRIPVIIK